MRGHSEGRAVEKQNIRLTAPHAEPHGECYTCTLHQMPGPCKSVRGPAARDPVPSALTGCAAPAMLRAMSRDSHLACAQAAWAHHDFILARDLLAALAREVDPARYGPYRDLVAAYAAWDAFDTAAALAAIEQALAALEREPEHPLAAQRAHLCAQAALLARLAPLASAQSEPPDLAVLARPDVVASLAFTLRRSARQHAGAGRYELAVLLLYRLLELLMQRRLALRGLSTVAPDYAALAVPDLANALAALRLALLGEVQTPELPRTIGLGAGLVLLDILGDPVTAAVDWPLLRICLPARSRSLLIHGFRLLGGDSWRDFSRLVEPILQRYAEVEGLDWAGMEAAYQFVGLSGA